MCAASSTSFTTETNSDYQSWRSRFIIHQKYAWQTLSAEPIAKATEIIQEIAEEIKKSGDTTLGFRAINANFEVVHLYSNKFDLKKMEKIYQAIVDRDRSSQNHEGGQKLLNIALQKQDAELVDWLLRNALDPYKRDKDGANVIHKICEKGSPPLVINAIKICLELQEKPENQNKESPLLALAPVESTPLHKLLFRNSISDHVDLILKNGLEKTVLDFIYMIRNVKVDEIWSEMTSGVESSGRWYHEQSIDMLLALVALDPRGEKYQLTHDKLYQILNRACERHLYLGNNVLFSWFREDSTLSENGEQYGKNALIWAAKNLSFPLMEALLGYRGFVDKYISGTELKMIYQTFQQQWPPRINQDRNRMINILKHIPSEYGLDCDKNSLISHAILSRNTDLLKLACGNANQLKLINLPNIDGETPLMLALRMDYTEGLEILIRHGAKPDNNEGWNSVIDYLIENEKLSSVVYILTKYEHTPTKPLKSAKQLFLIIERAPNPELHVLEAFFNSNFYLSFERKYLRDLDFLKYFPSFLKLSIDHHKFDLANRLAPHILTEMSMPQYLFDFLCQMIVKRNVEGVGYILGAVKNLSIVDSAQNTLLHYASKAGHFEIFKMVLKSSHPITYNKPNAYGETPLLLAAFGGHHKVVETLYRMGFKLKQDQLRRILKSAKSSFDINTLYFLMRKHPKYFKYQPKYHEYLFSKALKTDPIHLRIIERVLNYGFVPTLNKEQTDRLLFGLVENNRVAMLSYLMSLPKVSAGNSDNSLTVNENDEKSLPTSISEQTDSEEVSEPVVTTVPPLKVFSGDKTELVNKALTAACKGANSEIVSVLLAHTSKFIEKNREFGSSLLKIALQNDNRERLKIIHLLWEHGVDLNECLFFDMPSGEVQGLTPLMYEVRYGSIEGLKFLLYYGADINLKIENSTITPYEMALIWKNYDHANYLRMRGADTQLLLVDVTPNHRVMIASATGSRDLLETALSDGGSLAIEYPDKNTPLHLAAKYGHHELVVIILELHPDSLNKRNLRGETPIHLAALRNEEHTVMVLGSRDANVGFADINGHIVTHIWTNRKFIVNPKRLNEPGEDPFIIPKAPKKATLRPLFEIAVRISGKGGLQEKRMEYLSNMINTRKDYTSVPADPEDKRVWYAELENNLRYLGYRLTFTPPGKKKPSFSPEHQENVVRDLSLASEMCGSAWMTETIKQIEFLIDSDKCLKSESADIRIYTLLQSYKKWVMSQMQQRYEKLPDQVEQGMGQHIQMYLEKYLNPLLGFKGINKRIKDTLEPTVLKRKNLLDDFLEIYTYTNIHSWLKEEIHARMKPEEIYAIFGGFLTKWVDNHIEIVAKFKGVLPSQLEADLDEDYDWVSKHLFAPRSEKYVLNDLGLTLLLLATDVIHRRGVQL